MNSIKFSQNWNKKLNCQAFTTIRKPSNFWILGNTYHVILSGIIIKEAKLIAISNVDPALISETTARLDTGFSKYEMLELLKKMHGELPPEMFLLTFLTTKIELSAFKITLANEIEKLSAQMAGLPGNKNQ